MPSRRASATIRTTTASPNKKMSTVIDTLAGVTSVSLQNCTVPVNGSPPKYATFWVVTLSVLDDEERPRSLIALAHPELRAALRATLA